MAGIYIFISYRREDAAGHAGRLYDRLVQRFGEAQVFLDFNAIPGATDFTEEILDALARATVVLVVIGPHWCDASDPTGNKRLFMQADLVRAEVGAALSKKVTIVPVLVGGASMPRTDQLPRDLRGLSNINAITVSDRSFSIDVDVLIQTIARTQQAFAPVNVASEIYAGQWEVCKTNYGMAPVTLNLELRRDGTLVGRLAGMGGGAGQMLTAFGQLPDLAGIMGPLNQLVGQITYRGTWRYDSASKLLTLQLVGQVPGIPAASETWQMTITGEDRGVYLAVDQALMQYTLKRVG